MEWTSSHLSQHMFITFWAIPPRGVDDWRSSREEEELNVYSYPSLGHTNLMKTVDSLLSRFVSAVDDRYPVELTYPKKGYLLTQISKFRRGMSEATKGIIRSLSAISMLLCSLSGCPPPFCFWMIPLFPPIADGLLPHDGDHGWILLPPPREGGKLCLQISWETPREGLWWVQLDSGVHLLSVTRMVMIGLTMPKPLLAQSSKGGGDLSKNCCQLGSQPQIYL